MQNKQNSDFTKSSFSGAYGCVGVKRDGNKIIVTNTKKENDIVCFTPFEWKCFVEGVKAGEFDEFSR